MGRRMTVWPCIRSATSTPCHRHTTPHHYYDSCHMAVRQPSIPQLSYRSHSIISSMEVQLQSIVDSVFSGQSHPKTVACCPHPPPFPVIITLSFPITSGLGYLSLSNSPGFAYQLKDSNLTCRPTPITALPPRS
ncbi:unnamed protein product [Hymenolepis diminuta]|uniref:Uncharacterized protein n=1 Tax=Hymenolepis diminuta TaxID=6216 RepID=A0A564YEF6_HYMDI|nr:unnamed protein product [Hymenolepis diminuta]VUZ45667.1 unnamed protein product [Hymenolepis diminuta]VUZ50093.1 unnamed protein product [Hymenolepis diminuta]VUZ50094.1 unnamed protein product [Hymenolepis diminuta]